MAKVLADTRQQVNAQAPAGIQKQTIWMSQRQADGSWGQAERAPAPLDDDVNATVVWGALPDDNTLLTGRLDVRRLFDQWGQLSTETDLDKAILNLGKPAAPPKLPVPDPSRDDRNDIVGLNRRVAEGWSALVPSRSSVSHTSPISRHSNAI